MILLPARTDRRTIAMLLPVVVFPFAIYFKRPTTIITILLLLLLLLITITVTIILFYYHCCYHCYCHWKLIFPARGYFTKALLCRYWLDDDVAVISNLWTKSFSCMTPLLYINLCLTRDTRSQTHIRKHSHSQSRAVFVSIEYISVALESSTSGPHFRS